MRDFTAVASAFSYDALMVVHPSVPAKTVKEFIALAKAKPGALTYASSGPGSNKHMGGELFKLMTGTDMLHVAYKGSTGARNDIIGGHVHMMFDEIPAVGPNVLAGQVRALGTTGPKRAPGFPDVPTVSEAGVPGYEHTGWSGIMVPAGTPRPIVERLNAEINKLLAKPATKAIWDKQGAETMSMTPAEFEAYLRADLEKWAKVVKAGEHQAGVSRRAPSSVNAAFSRSILGPPPAAGLCYGVPFTCQGGIMRAVVCAIVAAIGLAAIDLAAHPAFAQADRTAAAFWRAVQANCNATAAKPPGEFGRRIAQTAIEEFTRFGGHQIDSNGRLFHFGLTEAEHEEDDGGGAQASLGHLGWWQVMKYWRSLYGSDAPDKLEVRGYRDASTSAEEAQVAALLRTSAARLLRLADDASDPAEREILREAAVRAAVIDTSWSAAFVSYVVRQSGVDANAFQFANAHRAYIYDAFATSAAELTGQGGGRLYRACPLGTRPRAGDLLCQQREPALADASDEAVRERIRAELGGGADARSIRRTHCEVVAHVDARARKLYTIGGNVNQAVSARKLNLRRGLKFSASQQKGHCGGPGQWTLPQPSTGAPHTAGHTGKCSLNDKKWFVLLQLR